MMNFTSGLRHKSGIMKWLVPLGLVLIVIAYELGPSRWIYDSLGFTTHLIAEIILFGSIGPVLTYLILELMSRWIAEKETAETQAALLSKAQQKELEIRQLSDDTLQVLFATSLLMAIIKSKDTISPSISAQIEVTEKALDQSIEKLRFHLLDQTTA